ncbi:putative methyltransferase C9orf114 homolog [Pocillopora damicornis]|uniref:putative methyltransferase C9orf114 homolog n=1 Tax=Pocillopora damicornis TaxID=46731 RepID=UPI000F551E49|nr:putative methyltransferase C9orf114 homolog [Pocillopora damicornis]
MKKKAKHKLGKRRRDSSPEQENTVESKIHKTDANGTTTTGRHFTISLALPGSILDNAQSPELRTYLAGQIARALAVFSIDEVVVFDESGKAKIESSSGLNHKSDPNILLARILQYLECPQYLRKDFSVFTQSPYKDGYDVTIGTSERGTMVDDLVLPNFRYI